ncbi:hypothetical protein PHLCEN_2v442 [Hermanssonia centrifuga]|uniref:Uncharacterized protein n=1 Tax=Hermanssonia centrifuga TaxID=98765 RepID=A0A2R6S6A8_9APHY|nr:hypothetical protein PHLCEN_2v442 [Hermanssonia centrifuga]
MTSDVSGSFGGRSSPVTSSSIIPTENEFYVSVELYLSRAAAAARKPQPPRKKTEKRESLRSSSSTNDLNQKKVKGD